MSLIIGRLRREDIREASALFSGIVDELHGSTSEKHKEFYKNRYSEASLAKLIDNRQYILFTAGEGGRIVGILFGRVSGGTGYIHWLGVSRDKRRSGIANALLDRMLEEARAAGCLRIEAFTYPEISHMSVLFGRKGYEEAALIEKNLFACPVLYMRKYLVPKENIPPVKIVLIGTAGQGIKLLAQVLAGIFSRLGYNIAMNILYGASVREGLVKADLIISLNKIEVPFIDKSDMLFMLSEYKGEPQKTAACYMDGSIGPEGDPGANIEADKVTALPFHSTSVDKFGSPMFINMITLGMLLDLTGVNIEKVNFTESLPARLVEQNTEAVKYGYMYMEYLD